MNQQHQQQSNIMGGQNTATTIHHHQQQQQYIKVASPSAPLPSPMTINNPLLTSSIQPPPISTAITTTTSSSSTIPGQQQQPAQKRHSIGGGGGRAIMPTSQIEMTISCRSLMNRDILSKSDPFCLVLMKDSWQEKFFELGRTETIQDTLNPEWVKKFIINYNFETVQKIRFEVWDQDPDDKEFLGHHETTLAEIVSFASRQYIRTLSGMPNKNSGTIIIVTEELSSCKQIVQMHFAAENLPRSICGLFRPDPFLVISRSNEDGTFSVVIKSEPVRSSKCPLWLPITMRVRTLCNGDYDRTIKIDCYDSRSNGKHVLIGTCFTSLRELCTTQSSVTAPISSNRNVFVSLAANKRFLMQPPKTPSHHHHSSTSSSPFTSGNKSGSNRVNSGNFDNIATGTETGKRKATIIPVNGLDQASDNCGQLILKEITVTEEITFIDYIKSGTQMHFAVAIDFTASNGPPRDPHSLHFLDIFGGKLNPYEIALRAVGEIIQQYDSAGMFPAFGFGARIPPSGEVSHQFALNGNPSHPYCSSISEILSHYRNCLANVTLYGPTNFSSVIHNTTQIASKFQDGKHYFILLIITDGIISDMHQTKNAIIDASKLPISIIIVGVGNADFAAMDELDSDDIRLSVNGRYAERDIVQFVPLNKFISKTGPYIRSQADLAREVLAEIPDQMTGYMKSKGFIPNLDVLKNEDNNKIDQ
ncbi:Copine-9 [Dermatophagoides pteronyssinus]|uniref:Copine-9 n=1 Tax=Dermatophagoides pteronyssinus TaxID=6956 RepID=A0ABQ8JT33_DERPT|nr:Copine-9 [Dermatophagoides pteronyssinus]